MQDMCNADLNLYRYSHLYGISIEDMIQTALDNGVKMIACQMSMDVMGVNADELMDGVEIGGVATYLGEAEKANLNLFI